MRSVRNALLAGAAALGIAGVGGLALAAAPAFHEMTVQLPGGGAAHIRYTGDVAPKVTLVSGSALRVSDFGFWNVAYPFAEFDRISATMDRQINAMLAQAQAMQRVAISDGLNEAVLKDVPPGTSSYSMVTTIGGNGFCSRSVQITSSQNGGKPKVVEHSSGDCGSPSGGPAPAVTSGGTQSNGLQSVSLKTAHATQAQRRGI